MANMDIIAIMATIIQKNKTNFCSAVSIIMCFCFLASLSACSKLPETAQTEPIGHIESDVGEESIRHKEITFNGKQYAYNDHLTNIVFMGVDNETIPDTVVGAAGAGQADTIFLVSHDRITGNTNVISIPRDTIATVDVFDRDGEPLGPSTLQICLSYAFGDGKHESCRNTKEAVSRLFYRLPIQYYCSLTLESMEEIAKLCGTISVTLPNDSLSSLDATYREGIVFDVTSENAELFFRYRNTNVSHSALERSERHQAYLRALEEQYLSGLYTEPEQISGFYSNLEPYMVTNMYTDDFVKIMESFGDGTLIHTWSIPGEAVSTDKYDEYHVNEDALYEQIISCFFEEVTRE